ncbi:MAG: glycogen synthase GlgA [Gammaproteobacteria bacterium]|nr:glycogen synthase GlgA [Gammaproteobacteria bacterium]
MKSRTTPRLNLLFASSEAQPLIKTGGLADVAGSLPLALSQLGHDVRLVLPAYPQAVNRAIPLTTAATLELPGYDGSVRILEGRLNDSVPLYLIDAPGLLDRPGNPYTDASGSDWRDNAQRFALFCHAIVVIALNRAGLSWRPDLVHCNDWQTGLVPALLASEDSRPASVFTIHNLAYQGVFNRTTFDRLELPNALWSHQGLEFHDNFSFIKGGLAFADWITTVSPTYAQEILTSALGYGLEGLLQHRSERLEGVLNGIDYSVWDPASDPAIPQHYDAATFSLKKINKLHLQREVGLPENEHALLFGHIGRLVAQKGVDLILQILPGLLRLADTQLIILGSGDPGLERFLQQECGKHPDKIATVIGYDEPLAHRIEAGCDLFLMPSRFEPCGLNQLYSLRYGTVPIVHRTGGLADTVINATPRNLLNGSATGFVFDRPDVESLWRTIDSAIDFHKRPEIWWQKLAINGMQQDYSWDRSAQHYVEIYQKAIDHPAPNPLAKRTTR